MPFEQLKIKSTFSLNDGTHFKSGARQVAPAAIESPAARTPDREVSPEEVNAAVLKYAEARQNDGARQIATILKTAGFLFSGSAITLTLNNETQKEQFLAIRQHFMDQIRLELQNSSISLEIVLSQDTAQAKAYKPTDIFKAMSEKNPALLELKKRFDLEIDY